MSARDPVEVILAAGDAGLDFDETDARLRELFPGITYAEMAAAYREAGARQLRQGEALLRLHREIERGAGAEKGRQPRKRLLKAARDLLSPRRLS